MGSIQGGVGRGGKSAKRQRGRWSGEEYEILRSKGFVPGRSRRSVRNALVRIGAKKPGCAKPRWSPEHLSALKSMRGQGYSAERIAESGLLPQSLNAIRKKLGRLGLTDARPIFKLDPQQRGELKEFLKRHWEGRTPQDLTDMWNEARPTIRLNKKRIVAYLTDLGIKIHYGEVQRINNARRREAKILESKSSPPVALEKVRLSRVEMMRRRIELGRDLWSGMPVDEAELVGA